MHYIDTTGHSAAELEAPAGKAQAPYKTPGPPGQPTPAPAAEVAEKAARSRPGRVQKSQSGEASRAGVESLEGPGVTRSAWPSRTLVPNFSFLWR